MRVELGSELRVAGAPPALQAALRRAATFQNPEYRRRLRLGRSTWGVEAELRLWRFEDGWLAVPRGLATLLPQGVSIEDRRLTLPKVEFGWKGSLWPEQRAAALAAVRAGGGLVVGACGSGKTEMGMACLSAWRQPALWIVHTVDLAGQALERARRLFDLGWWACGMMAAGKRRMGTHLTVATVQTLIRRDLADLGRRFGALVVDEAHHVPSATLSEVVQALPARYRLGLTATPDRADGLGPVLPAVMGPEVARLTVDELAAAGRVLRPVVRRIQTRFRHPYTDQPNELMDRLIHDRARNRQIAERLAEEARAGHRCLALSMRVWHCDELRRVLADVAPDVPAAVLTGRVGRTHRRDVLRDLQRGRLLVLFATQVADEGLDVPAVDRLALVAGGRDEGRVGQRVGRAMRVMVDKEPQILDFVDDGCPVLKAQARARVLTVYRALGLQVVEEAA